jgi:putative RNA 2'-phosphotransferase
MATRASKFLSLVLRHDPARIGITLDAAGWTDVDALLAALRAHGTPLSRAELHEIVASSDKQRFALSADGARVRASQGHSVAVDLGLPPREPPAVLYHGTVADALPGIRAAGLVRGARHHVHLSSDVDTARTVGGRRGAPVILGVCAGAMHAAGRAFYRSDNGVWLTEHVPPAFVAVAAQGHPGASGRDGRARIAASTLAACELGAYLSRAGEVVPLREAIDRARSGTVLHDAERAPVAPPGGARRRAAAAPAIAVTTETTIEAVTRLAGTPGGHLACLSFASAKHPGGRFLEGAQAQEEAIARSSALYPCLVTQPAHYERNRASGSELYLDLAIFSPDVPVFRTDAGGWLERPALASVITCAAPNARALREAGQLDVAAVAAALHRRARLVLDVAVHHGVARLVLGAWGAGVFGNDPVMVARALAELLRGDFAGAFAEVVLAIPPGPNHAPFAAALAPAA